MIRVKKSKNPGQGMTEYLIIVALIAVTAIAVIKTTGTNLKIGFAKISDAITGNSTSRSYRAATEAEIKRRSMSDFSFGADGR